HGFPIAVAALLLLALSLCPRTGRADGLGIEALVTGTAFTSKPADRPSISYADQPGSGIGGLLRLRGGIARDFRWIVGGVAEQVQRGAFLGPAPESGNRFGGQLGVGWMASENVRLELVLEGGTRSNGNYWFNYFGLRPALTWLRHTPSGFGVAASLSVPWRKESQDDLGPLAPAGGRELGLSLAVGLSYE